VRPLPARLLDSPVRERDAELVSEFEHQLVEPGDAHDRALVPRDQFADPGVRFAPAVHAPERPPSERSPRERIEQTHQAPVVSSVADEDRGERRKQRGRHGDPRVV